MERNILYSQTKSLKKSRKNEIIGRFSEVDFHKELQHLFQNLYQDSTVYVTHGLFEYGKDLAILKKDEFGNIETTAVVVKMGRLSGKNLGQVSDIVNQVNDCFEMPTEIPDSPERYKVNKVIIVIAGTISKQGRDRLADRIERWQPNFTILNIDKLSDLFSDYYPQIFFGGRNVMFLENKIKQLTSSDIIFEDRSVSEYFIEPNIKKHKRDTLGLIVQNNATKKDLNEVLFGEKETYSNFLNYLIEDKIRKVHLQGDSGAGKSVFVKKITIDLLKNAIDACSLGKDAVISIPIYLKAIELVDITYKTFENIIVNECTNENIILKPILIIVDGLDEISKQNANNIVEIVNTYSKSEKISILVASRKSYSCNHTLNTDFLRIELVSLELNQAITMIKSLTMNKNQNLLTSLINGLEELQRKIPIYPLSLKMLVEIAETNREVPASITELYRKFLALALGEEDKSNSIKTIFAPQIKDFFLQDLAFELFYINDRTKITSEEFQEFISSYKDKHKIIAENLDEFITEIERTGILHINTIINFSHKTFLEYFIAKYLYRKRDEIQNFEDILHKSYYRPLWNEVVYFYYGQKREINNDEITRLLDYETDEIDDINFSKFLIGRLLQFAWHTESPIKKGAIEKGLTYINKAREKSHNLLARDIKVTLPKIVTDAVIYQFFDYAYNSLWLYEEMKELLEDKIFQIEEKAKQGKELDAEDLNNLYFATLFAITYSQQLPQGYLERFIKSLMNIEPYILDKEKYILYLALFNSSNKSNKFELLDGTGKALDKLYGKLVNKFPLIYEKLFRIKDDAFKAKVERDKLTHHKKGKVERNKLTHHKKGK